MAGVNLHKLERVFSGVAFEAVDRYQNRTNERFRLGLAEYTEEWHIAASGSVAFNELVTTDVALEFSMDFFQADEQRHGDLPTPTLSFGSYQDSTDSPTVVMATACVRSWQIREDGAYVGCTVNVGVFLPGEPDATLTDFDIVVHLQFSGWGAPFDSEGAGEASDPGEGGD